MTQVSVSTLPAKAALLDPFSDIVSGPPARPSASMWLLPETEISVMLGDETVTLIRPSSE